MNLGMHYQHFTTHSMKYHDVLINPVLYKSISLIFEKKNHFYIFHIIIAGISTILQYKISRVFFFSFRLQVQDIQFENVCLLKISWLKDK